MIFWEKEFLFLCFSLWFFYINIDVCIIKVGEEWYKGGEVYIFLEVR